MSRRATPVSVPSFDADGNIYTGRELNQMAIEAISFGNGRRNKIVVVSQGESDRAMAIKARLLARLKAR